jgi:Ca2+-transporting ATPase
LPATVDANALEATAGLSASEAAARTLAEGPNELGVSQRRGLRTIAWEVLKEPMFLLLLGAGAVYLLLGDTREALILLGFVLIIMSVTVLQERRSDGALEALRELSSPRAQVQRDDQWQRIPGREVVRGDLLRITEGDRIAADGLLLQAHELATDESMLSGESLALPKQAGERVFAGTLAVGGQGLVRVEAIGAATEMGRIGQSLQGIALQASPLRDEVARLTRRLVVVAVAFSLLLTLLFWLLRGGLLQAVLAGITLAMSLLPQELPVIMIVFLALAARRLASQQVLTRRLNAVETLGETTVLCVDKTGTLTQNRMAVAALGLPEGETLDPAGPQPLPSAASSLLQAAYWACETEPHDPMELAIHRLADAQGLAAGLQGWTLAREYELSPALLAMSHGWQPAGGGARRVVSKGAPEAVMRLCRLPEGQRAQLAAQALALADRGLRVLGVAQAALASHADWPADQQDFAFEWLGLIALADPLRPEVPDAIARCRRAGIRVLMITGDHPGTATAIAAQAGLATGAVLCGDEIERLSPAALAQRLRQVQVFARVRPQQKLALVEALKAQGEVVAMTGDGVNDAPALKAAHIGIAMGQRGSDVAREAASLVLLHDDFAAIVSAIAMGRRSYANLRLAMVYTLAVHLPIVALALFPVLLGLPLVLLPLHIAFLELLIDPACSLVFEAEPGDPALMTQPPRDASEALLGRNEVAASLLRGLLLSAAVVGLHAAALAQGQSEATAGTLAFVLLVLSNSLLILPSRTADRRWRSLWQGLPSISRWVLLGSLLAMFAVTLLPPLADAFGLVPLSGAQWALVLGLGLALLIPLQLAKRLRFGLKPSPPA